MNCLACRHGRPIERLAVRLVRGAFHYFSWGSMAWISTISLHGPLHSCALKSVRRQRRRPAAAEERREEERRLEKIFSAQARAASEV